MPSSSRLLRAGLLSEVVLQRNAAAKEIGELQVKARIELADKARTQSIRMGPEGFYRDLSPYGHFPVFSRRYLANAVNAPLVGRVECDQGAVGFQNPEHLTQHAHLILKKEMFDDARVPDDVERGSGQRHLEGAGEDELRLLTVAGNMSLLRSIAAWELSRSVTCAPRRARARDILPLPEPTSRNLAPGMCGIS